MSFWFVCCFGVYCFAVNPKGFAFYFLSFDFVSRKGPRTVVQRGKAARQINTNVRLVEAKDSEWILFCWQFYRNIRWPKDPKKHCWNWQGATLNGKGSYGRFHYKGHRWMAHRISWEMHYGKQIPEGQVIRHKCNRPQCVNPHHLTPGTQMENMRDMLNANRQGWVRKVSDKDIADIQASKLKGSELARKYGVSNTTIHRIIKGKK